MLLPLSAPIVISHDLLIILLTPTNSAFSISSSIYLFYTVLRLSVCLSNYIIILIV